TLESDKAAMDIPSPHSGVVKSIKIKVGDKVSQDAPILELLISAGPAQPAAPAPAAAEKPAAAASAPAAPAADGPGKSLERKQAEFAESAQYDSRIYAGPAVRKLARE